MKLLLFIILLFNYFLSATSVSDSMEVYKEGLEFYHKKDYVKSYKLFKKALKINSNITYPYAMIGNCLYFQGEYEEAIHQYQNYIDKPYNDEDLGYIYLYISKCYRKLYDFHNALKYLKIAEKYEFYEDTDYYFEALNFFKDLEKNKNKIIKDNNYSNKIFEKCETFTNDFYIQNNLGNFFLLKNNNKIINNLNIVLSYFEKAIILNGTNNFNYFKDYYSTFIKKAELHKKINIEYSINNFNYIINLIEKFIKKFNNPTIKKDLKKYKRKLIFLKVQKKYDVFR